MKTNIVHRTDTRAVARINPSHPQFVDRIVGECEVRGRLNAIWINGCVIGSFGVGGIRRGYTGWTSGFRAIR